jgi:site-specific DNA-methyltransferase (adenine-specific)
MRTIPDQSINCCVTSPPYYGLRDYGCDGQIGLEETPDQFIAKLVDVFREVKRVLKDDGTLWVNIGDSYASFRDGKATPDTTRGNDNGTLVPKGNAKNRMASTFRESSVKHKDLIGIPWMLAFALRADGWYLRQDIIWHKPNPMPESVTDRCTKAHEYIFLLTKSQKYYFDHNAMKEKAVSLLDNNAFRNKRSVWSVNVRPYKEAHFATYPSELITPCILAGCPEDGIVLDPFGGSGTTAEVAIKNSRNAILCELNPNYIEIIKNRLNKIELKLI